MPVAEIQSPSSSMRPKYAPRLCMANRLHQRDLGKRNGVVGNCLGKVKHLVPGQWRLLRADSESEPNLLIRNAIETLLFEMAVKGKCTLYRSMPHDFK